MGAGGVADQAAVPLADPFPHAGACRTCCLPDAESCGAARGHPTPCRIVLYLAGADSSLCMLSLDRGELVGKVLRPKNPSRPLAMALLDEEGVPLPRLNAPVTLPWANNNTAPSASAAAGARPPSTGGEGSAAGPGRDSSLGSGEGQGLGPAGTSWQTASGATHGSQSTTEAEERENPLRMQELPSDDELDHHLAAAVSKAGEWGACARPSHSCTACVLYGSCCMRVGQDGVEEWLVDCTMASVVIPASHLLCCPAQRRRRKASQNSGCPRRSGGPAAGKPS